MNCQLDSTLNLKKTSVVCDSRIDSSFASFQTNFLLKNNARSKFKIMSSLDKDFRAKQEGENKDSKTPKTTYGSRQWAGFKNPRIVCVSRSSGGKDRHSKVCTVRGLRDRRIRLSVPTAIQLYDLQDRLGLSQPSKVVDWLIDNTKDDIDKLPPLQMPPGGDFSHFHQAKTLVPHDFNSSHSSLISPFFDPNTQRMKGKEVENEVGNINGAEGLNFFPLSNPSSLPGFSYNPYHDWEPSSLSLSPFGNQGFSSQADSSHGTTHSLSLLPSSLTFPPAPQFFFGPPTATTPPLFPQLPPYMSGLGEAHDPRQFSHFQLLSSRSQHLLSNPSHHINDSQGKSIPSNLNSKEDSRNTGDRQMNKGKSVL